MPTTIADKRRRVTLPYCLPGDRFDVSRDGRGRIILQRLEISEGVPVVHLTLGADDWPTGLPSVSPEQIAEAIRREREDR